MSARELSAFVVKHKEPSGIQSSGLPNSLSELSMLGYTSQLEVSVELLS